MEIGCSYCGTIIVTQQLSFCRNNLAIKNIVDLDSDRQVTKEVIEDSEETVTDEAKQIHQI